MITAEHQPQFNRVLVIDDELVVRELLIHTLTAWGCAVDGAVNGEDGLAKAERGNYEVIVTDIKMPKMDGFQFIRNLKVFDPEIPVIIVTAVGDIQNAVKAIRLGAYDFIHKPFGAGEGIWHAVRRAIEFRRTRLENRQYQCRIEKINSQLLHELKIARNVQQNYAAKSLRPGEGLDVAAIYEPCLEIGGDLYGAFPIGESKLALYIADVSGHGPAAALITAMVKMNIDSIADMKELHGLISSPHELLAELDRALVKCSENCMFVTMFYSVLDCRTGKLTYCSAGHCPPLFLRSGADSAVFLDGARSTPLTVGAAYGFEYQSCAIDFRPGDLLVLYTDGLVEVSNPAGDRFGTARLAEAIESFRGRGGSAQEQVQEISRRIRGFASGVQPQDDVAMLAARRKPLTSIG